jgi:hypothetical protein
VDKDPTDALVRQLRSVVCALWFMSISGITLLLLAGFKPLGFTLDMRVLIAIVGGVSLQYIVAMVSPLVSGISTIHVARLQKHRDDS